MNDFFLSKQNIFFTDLRKCYEWVEKKQQKWPKEISQRQWKWKINQIGSMIIDEMSVVVMFKELVVIIVVKLLIGVETIVVVIIDVVKLFNKISDSDLMVVATVVVVVVVVDVIAANSDGQ